jgi:hypothetical protein
MDRQVLTEQLAEAEQHIAQGDRNITQQREIVAALERNGHDSGAARQLLAQFEDLQRIHIAHRDKLREQLTA